MLDFDNGFMFQLFRVNGTFRHYVRLSWQLRKMCSLTFLSMELVRDFLAMKVIKTLQLLNFNFLVQFGDITCHESIYLLTVLNLLECGRTKNYLPRLKLLSIVPASTLRAESLSIFLDKSGRGK